MFENGYHQLLLSSLTRVLHSKNQVKDSKILQAYATLHAIFSVESQDYQQSYFSTIQAYIDVYDRALLCAGKKPYNISHADFLQLRDLFLCFSLGEFLRFGLPGFVCDVESTVKIFEHYFGENLLLFVQHIIQIKMTVVKLAEVGQNVVDSGSEEDVLAKLYDIYTGLETNARHHLSKDLFFKLYRSINQYALDSNELRISLRSGTGSAVKAVYQSVFNLRDRLGLSKQQQIDFLHRFFVLNENNPRLVQQYSVYQFTREKDENTRVKVLGDAMRKYATMYPLECLCATYLAKGRVNTVGLSNSEDVVCPNDVTLENGLIFSLFSSSVFDDAGTLRPTIFFPSPFFIRKWQNDSVLKKIPVVFVLKNDKIREIINCHFYQGTYAHKPINNAVFITYDEWLLRVKETGDVGFDRALQFACNWDVEEQNRWLRTVKTHVKNPVEIFSLISSYEFERAQSPFSAELSDSQISISAVSLIPQGINNSSSPRRKIILRGTIFPHCMSSSTENVPTKIYSFTLNTDLKTQALALMSEKPVEIQQQNLAGLYDSIRKLFNEEILKRRASGRSKVAAFSYEFTPDITIWCSKSYPKNNSSRPRLEACICKPAAQEKVKQGYMNRGERIKDTCKRVTRIPDNGISEWLEEEYPFSIVLPRHASNIPSGEDAAYKLKSAVNIREEIIDAYAPLLDGNDIALKTLWYIHPDIRDKFAGDDYLTFTQIAKTEIGYLRLSEISGEKCEELLIRCFGDESRERLWGRYTVLSRAIDQAVKYGYCEENLLQYAIKDQKIRDRLFLQVRSALTKKHFTFEELLRAYYEIVGMLDQGRKEYIGVLIRLLTGLESNVVCALRIKDFVEILEYGFSQINVTCQLTNDGSERRGFERLEDYRCFPCVASLTERIKCHIAEIVQMVPEFADVPNIPIVTTDGFLRSEILRYKAYQPRKLEELCKSIIKSVGIEEHIIEVPDNVGGTKETNLNRYGGDFFRENFRHWSLKAAKMEIDEVLFILGNKPLTTFGRYYCDYHNEAAQLLMFVKLQRLDALLSCPENVVGKAYKKESCSLIKKELFLSGRRPLHLHVEMKVKQGGGIVTMKARGRFGLKVFSTPIELID